MDENKKYRDKKELPPLPEGRIPWSRTKEEVWKVISEKTGEGTARMEPKVRSLRPLLAAAATLALILALGSLMRFYTVRVSAPENMAVELPDGSEAYMLEGSEISWHPWWWPLKREVNFEGESRFEVEKGTTFAVVSKKGKTLVLGTVFTVNTIGDNYQVSCESGKVRVVSNLTASEVILLPGEKAEMNDKGTLEYRTKNESGQKESFTFTSAPLNTVLMEISRAYGVKIVADTVENLVYTGNFGGEIPVDNVLRLVCKPFGLKVIRISDEEYRIGK
ncbi:MAG: FecR family protein [Bacteroidota bacterium]